MAEEGLIPIVISGQPHSIDPLLECLPFAIKELGASIAGRNLPTLIDSTEEEMFLQTVAFMLRVPYATINNRYNTLRQKQLRQWLVGALTLSMILAVLAGYALYQRSEALQRKKDADTNAGKASKSEKVAKEKAELAERKAEEARQNAFTAERRLAEGLVAQGDALSQAGHWGEAKKVYWEAYDKFLELELSPFPAQAALCVAHAKSPPELTCVALPEGQFSCGVSEDLKHGMSTDRNGELTLWNLRTGRAIGKLSGQGFPSIHVAFVPNRRLAVAGSVDGSLTLWDLADGRKRWSHKRHKREVGRVALSSDGRYVLSCGPDDIKVSVLETGAEVITLAEGDNPRRRGGVAMFAPGSRIFSGNTFGDMLLWDVKDRKVIKEFPGCERQIWSVACSEVSNVAMSASADHTVRIWNLNSGEEVRRLLGHTSEVLSVASSKRGNLAISGGQDGTVRLWDAANGEQLKCFATALSDTNHVVIAPDGRLAVSGDASLRNSSFKTWSLSENREVRYLETESPSTNCIAFTPDSRMALIGGYSSAILVDLETGNELQNMGTHDGKVHGVACSPNGQLAITASADKSLKVWELIGGKELRTLTGHDGPVRSVAFASDGKTAISGSEDKTLKLWDVRKGELVRSFAGHSSTVMSVALGSDGRKAVSGSLDGTVRLWDVETGQQMSEMRGHDRGIWGVAISPDGQKALSGGEDFELKLWDLATGKELRTLHGHSDIITSVGFSPDGRWGLSASLNNMVKLWDLETGKELRTLGGYERRGYHGGYSGKVEAVAGKRFWCASFSPDGSKILAGDPTDFAIQWDLTLAPRNRDGLADMAHAMTLLGKNEGDATAAALLGRWYALRGVHDRAAELLQEASAAGIPVDPITLARCYWKVSRDTEIGNVTIRNGMAALAREKFREARSRESNEATIRYLDLVLSAIQ
jgi:WD40 repeat protein